MEAAFRGGTAASATLVFVVIVAIAAFLVHKAVPALDGNSASFLTERQWLPDREPSRFGIAALVAGTIVTSVAALVLAVPVALGVALFVSEYAPPRLKAPLGYVTDLLAAVPSVVYGLWGVFFLVPRMQKLQEFLAAHLSWVPFFRVTPGEPVGGRSLFAASVVLAIMVLPIVAAISREVFVQVPQSHREAALALGATKLEAIRIAVLPASRPGVVSAIMLGLGRALGETIAVALVLSAAFTPSLRLLRAEGGNTIAANIATKFGEAGVPGRGALIASGLVLFAITLVVNVVARAILFRNRRAA
ncbi:MAG TPA: phosphate ABC transporter permease subunit PstC [Frankiaceae bacterium]|nr:phosphate ABC transporter permease subunit PstC [Frankiaceae bacterium]